MNANDAYAKLMAHSRASAEIAATLSLLSWDQQVMIPPAAHAGRAGQIGALTAILHRRASDPAMGEWLAACEDSVLAQTNAASPEAANIRELRRDYDQAVKIPESLAVALAQAASTGQRAWELARKDNDFAAFAPHLDTLLVLSRQKAEALGYAGEAYDALLDLFEPGETVAAIAPILAELRDAATDILARVTDAPKPAPLPAGPYPIAAQERLLRQITARLGLPDTASRLDISTHPFSTLIGPGDARITTRFDEADFTKAFFGAVHETGHALYSLGHSGPLHYGTPMGEPASFAVHESQSRLWENQVARSLPFWEYALPLAAKEFPQLAGLSPEDIFKVVGATQPDLVRVDADETTYNPHIVLRFELELALIRGDLAVADLPGAWNEKSQAILGLTPPTDALGCLQDVHWSSGAFGYFPTYSLGNIYAACLFEAATKALPDLPSRMAAGDFAPLLSWLGQTIHEKGRLLRPRALLTAATGQAPTAAPLVRHLRAKASAIYGVAW